MEFKSEPSSVNEEAPMHNGDVGGKTVEVSQLQTLKCRGQLPEQSPAPSNTSSETRSVG